MFDFGARGGTRTRMVSRTILSRVRLPIPPLGHLLSTLFILTHIFLVVHRKNQKWEDYFLPTLNYYNISDLKLVPFSSFSIPNISSIVADISANVSLVPKLTFDFIFLPYATIGIYSLEWSVLGVLGSLP